VFDVVVRQSDSRFIDKTQQHMKKVRAALRRRGVVIK
jgi:hypothetical protein